MGDVAATSSLPLGRLLADATVRFPLRRVISGRAVSGTFIWHSGVRARTIAAGKFQVQGARRPRLIFADATLMSWPQLARRHDARPAPSRFAVLV